MNSSNLFFNRLQTRRRRHEAARAVLRNDFRGQPLPALYRVHCAAITRRVDHALCNVMYILFAFDALIGLAQVDAHIGSIVAELQRQGLWDNTLIIVCRLLCRVTLCCCYRVAHMIVERFLCRLSNPF
jgi:membrane-anchored protein YejM (alkaline phosphatase superfamily)